MKINHVKLKPGYVLKELGGEFCIFDENDSQNGSVDGMPSVNETCIFLWNNLERGADIPELIVLLAEKGHMEEVEAEWELEEFLAKLIHGGLIEYKEQEV